VGIFFNSDQYFFQYPLWQTINVWIPYSIRQHLHLFQTFNIRTQSMARTRQTARKFKPSLYNTLWTLWFFRAKYAHSLLFFCLISIVLILPFFKMFWVNVEKKNIETLSKNRQRKLPYMDIFFIFFRHFPFNIFLSIFTANLFQNK